jgi:hypothetical protein
LISDYFGTKVEGCIYSLAKAIFCSWPPLSRPVARIGEASHRSTYSQVTIFIQVITYVNLNLSQNTALQTTVRPPRDHHGPAPPVPLSLVRVKAAAQDEESNTTTEEEADEDEGN